MQLEHINTWSKATELEEQPSLKATNSARLAVYICITVICFTTELPGTEICTSFLFFQIIISKMMEKYGMNNSVTTSHKFITTPNNMSEGQYETSSY